jgi:hypothetical protein
VTHSSTAGHFLMSCRSCITFSDDDYKVFAHDSLQLCCFFGLKNGVNSLIFARVVVMRIKKECQMHEAMMAYLDSF